MPSLSWSSYFWSDLGQNVIDFEVVIANFTAELHDHAHRTSSFQVCKDLKSSTLVSSLQGYIYFYTKCVPKTPPKMLTNPVLCNVLFISIQNVHTTIWHLKKCSSLNWTLLAKYFKFCFGLAGRPSTPSLSDMQGFTNILIRYARFYKNTSKIKLVCKVDPVWF